MLQYIQQHWLEWFFGLIIAALGVGYKFLWNKYSAMKKENNGVKNGIKAILRHNIKSEGRRLLEQKYCTPEEFEDFEELYQPYHEDLGGNGTAQRVREAENKLKIEQNSYGYEQYPYSGTTASGAYNGNI